VKLLRPAAIFVVLAALSVVVPRAPVEAKARGVPTAITRQSVRSAMKRVFEWQAANPVGINQENNNLWARAAFYAGVMAAYRSTGEREYLEQAMRWAEGRKWKLGERPRHADDHAPGQTYLELYMLRKEPSMIADTRATLDAMIAAPRAGREDWWWCDALFMSPPVLARLYAVTGEEKYLDFLNAMWWDTTDFLYDPVEKLYYRDASFKGKLDADGRKIFWSRGNGWVLAGTARVLEYLPKRNRYHARYVELLRALAASVSRLQGVDGLWRPSLLDPREAPVPETSGTGFFCYAIAWGINHGYLERRAYLPVVRRAWRGLLGSVRADGKLGWVQQIGAAPAKVTAEDNQEYGTGAFLLAGSEMYRLR
jgi:unsaturated rhamnogalacturonyl hydrolase